MPPVTPDDAIDRILRRPIDAGKPPNVLHGFSSQFRSNRATATRVDPCTGALGTNLPLDIRRGRPAGAPVLIRCSWHTGSRRPKVQAAPAVQYGNIVTPIPPAPLRGEGVK